MSITLGIICVFLALIVLIAYLSWEAGKQQERGIILKQVAKRKAEEQARANKVMDNVRNMSSDDIANRLRKISSK